MKDKFYTTTFLSIVALISFALFAFSGEPTKSTTTAGNVQFTFKTVTANGNYAPRHVLAAWVEDANGFVKSRLVQANNRKQYLYTWNTQSSGNEVDAVTGATLNSHQTHTIEWDCTDLSGAEVPDGDYFIWIEFTEKHGQGPLTSSVFTKGPNSQTITPTDEPNFIDMELVYTPDNISVENVEVREGFTIFPNPCKGSVNIVLNGSSSENSTLSIYNITGRNVYQQSLSNIFSINHTINTSDFIPGLYFVKVQQQDNVFIQKLIVQ
jgi:hypothetical protein